MKEIREVISLKFIPVTINPSEVPVQHELGGSILSTVEELN